MGKEVLWSSNLPISLTNASAQLLDSGNLVLNNSNNGEKLWESFQEPSDKLLTNMKLTANVRTGKKVQVISWKSPSDPPLEASQLASMFQTFPKSSFGMKLDHIGGLVHGMAESLLEGRGILKMDRNSSETAIKRVWTRPRGVYE
ncbi:G-type lectin S-receptor-like serine/threonine-protein kinase At1g11300 [Pistacia vera]|uniref:G-type lectin S-receptor-like serine/threonine-protein kinase At1g11300 n=1 Tax=Pistacia vera TaxID=55513 RepID=UPI0012630FAD|nr:G-type lectin S-receptor-like serine/threonine-protein kinase At1g11300 [Pistacia vera]